MKELFDLVWALNPEEVDELFEEVLKRKRSLHPEYEIMYMVVPKNNQEERNRIIEYIIGFLEKEQGDMRRRGSLKILHQKPLRYERK